jgi:nucleoside-diphosphate-sugar epimerase
VHGLRTIALRLTNVYGPRQCLTRDGLGFLPVFVRRAMQGEAIHVYGDGLQLRDCLHVDDVVRAMAIAVVSAESIGEVFNLGHPDALGLGAIAELTIAAAGGRSTFDLIEWPAEHKQIDIGSFHGDFSKAKRVLGWEPHVRFADGIAATIAFYEEHPWYLSST